MLLVQRLLNSPAGGSLKETGTIHWSSPNTGATNVSGFTALPADIHTSAGSFGIIRSYAYFWSATASGPRNMWGFWLSSDTDLISWGGGYITCGKSVRCVKD